MFIAQAWQYSVTSSCKQTNGVMAVLHLIWPLICATYLFAGGHGNGVGEVESELSERVVLRLGVAVPGEGLFGEARLVLRHP